MTILHDPTRRMVFTDESVFPLHFADPAARDLRATQETLVAGLAALHGHHDGRCTEDSQQWPCKTVRILRASGATQ